MRVLNVAIARAFASKETPPFVKKFIDEMVAIATGDSSKLQPDANEIRNNMRAAAAAFGVAVTKG